MPTSDGYILAIDQGTTGTTVLVFNHEGLVQCRAYSEFTQHFPRPGWVEHDAQEIWSVGIGVVEAALRDGGLQPSEVTAIGITNQRETTVLWDRETGEPVARAIVWQDRRTADTIEELKRRDLGDLFKDKTGLLLDPYFSGTKIKWYLDNLDGLRDRCERGEIAFGTIDSWLVWKLTGGAEHATDYSNASRTLLYNIHSLEWDAELLEILSVPEAILPRVAPSSGLVGETDPQAFFGRRVPIAGIAGDQQAALFGQACYGEGLAKNTYGTGSFVLMNTGAEAVRSEGGLLSTIAWRLGDEPVEYALEGSIFVTGAAVQWLRDGLGVISSAAETEGLARSVDSNGGVYFVPALAGLGAPHWDPHARGMICGLTGGSTRAHLVRATLESIAYQSVDVVRLMESEVGTPLRELRADGGATANAFLMQFQADILDAPVEVPAIPETTALGAAYLAGLATGFWESRDELDRRWKLGRRYEPAMTASDRDRLYSGWLSAVEQAKRSTRG